MFAPVWKNSPATALQPGPAYKPIPFEMPLAVPLIVPLNIESATSSKVVLSTPFSFTVL